MAVHDIASIIDIQNDRRWARARKMPAILNEWEVRFRFTSVWIAV